MASKAVAAKAEIATELKNFSEYYGTRNIDKILEMYTDDVVFGFDRGPPGRGKEALAKAYHKLWDTVLVNARFDQNFQFDLVKDDLAHTMDIYDVMDENGKVTQAGGFRAFAVWKKIAGQWMLWRDMFDSTS